MNPAFKFGLITGLEIKSVAKLAWALQNIDALNPDSMVFAAGMKAALKIRLSE